MYIPRFAIQRWDATLSAGQSYMFCTYVNFQQQPCYYYIQRDANGNIAFNLVQSSSNNSEVNEYPYDCYKDITWWHFNAQTQTLLSDFILDTDTVRAEPESKRPTTSSLSQQNSGYCTTQQEEYLPDDPSRYTYFEACIDILSYITSSPAQYGMANYDVTTVCAGF